MTDLQRIPKDQQMTLADLLASIQDAIDTYKALDKEYTEVGRERIAAMNKLNELQKVFDERMTDFKKSAPINSDWRSS